jgi:hypothetical protein
MPTALMRIPTGAFPGSAYPSGALWNRGGLALDVPDCKRCDGACRHFRDYTPDCLALTFSGFGNVCFNRTYYLPFDGCTGPADSCTWSLAKACDPLGTQGPAYEVRLNCPTGDLAKIGRYFTVLADVPPGTWGSQFDEGSLDLLCGNFDPQDLPENPSYPGATVTVAPAHGHEPTDLWEVYEESLGWINVCDDCTAPDEIIVRLADFTTAGCGPLANGDYALTKGSICGGTTEYRYTFNVYYSLRLVLTPGTPKMLDVHFWLVSFGFNGPLWTFRAWSDDLFDCNGFVDYALAHYYGSSCNAANASVTLNPSS